MIKRTKRNGSLAWFGATLGGLLFILPAGGEGGLSGSGGMRGAMQNFASIVMNDVELGTSSTVIVANGEVVTQAELRIGQQIELIASDLAAEQADSVVYRATVVAPVQSIDLEAETITVLNQVVDLYVGSREDDIVVDNIVAGDWVEISGQRDNNRHILATYVGSASATGGVRLVGRIDQAVSGVTLVVDGVTIDANLATGTPLGDLLPGERVEVVGMLNGNQVQANLVSRLADMALADKDYVDLVGFISNVNAQNFVMEGLTVSYGPVTTYRNGNANKLEDGTRVEVEGALGVNGELIAGRILFKPLDRVEIRAPLEAIDLISGQLQLLGITLQATAATQLSHKSSSKFAFAGLDELVVGDYLRVRAFVDGEQTYAARIDREEFDEKARLKGFVSQPGAVQITVLGSSFTGDDNTRFKLKSGEVNSTEFYSSLQSGDRVRIDWDDLSMSPEEIKQL